MSWDSNYPIRFGVQDSGFPKKMENAIGIQGYIVV